MLKSLIEQGVVWMPLFHQTKIRPWEVQSKSCTSWGSEVLGCGTNVGRPGKEGANAWKSREAWKGCVFVCVWMKGKGGCSVYVSEGEKEGVMCTKTGWGGGDLPEWHTTLPPGFPNDLASGKLAGKIANGNFMIAGHLNESWLAVM